ncbi:hypothetical protein A1Q2_00127 [Trichosporon asahii var. asahii CBS 8904]|uniref:Uncharacterized protein n=2 Tax=Trichosporon asahii var. asahii TaxID=189963 RepID=K1W9X7_TRIAC|nr:hypothetical protein A1Q1_05745 [Trichosporon asahii var. asahii CBS 2479]EJT45832.1 hypothetical protein A1Q1_05745 [Trichosporon asahii var. asahii CBS 2479]EKD05573.1 hypothetical protein A1Q2_00127 [Trichosporon asahii var. asahii CBS 8904]
MTVSPKDPRPGAASRRDAELPPTPDSRRSSSVSSNSNVEVWRAGMSSLKGYGSSPELPSLPSPSGTANPTELTERDQKVNITSEPKQGLSPVPDSDVERQLQEIDAMAFPAFASPSDTLRGDSRELVTRKSSNLFSTVQKRKAQWNNEAEIAKKRHLVTLGSAFLAPLTRTSTHQFKQQLPHSDRANSRHISDRDQRAGDRDREHNRDRDRDRDWDRNRRTPPASDRPPSPPPALPDFNDDTTVLLEIPPGTTQITPRMLKGLVARTSERRNAKFLHDRRSSRSNLCDWLDRLNDAITNGDLRVLDEELDKIERERR